MRRIFAREDHHRYCAGAKRDQITIPKALKGPLAIVGLMLESPLEEGKQKIPAETAKCAMGYR